MSDTRKLAYLIISILFSLANVCTAFAAEYGFSYNPSLSPNDIVIGDSSLLKVQVYSGTQHDCRIAVESDGSVTVLVPSREFSFGGTHSGLFGPIADTHSEEFQVIPNSEGDHRIKVNYWVDGKLADSREIVLTVRPTWYWPLIIGGPILGVIGIVVAYAVLHSRLIRRPAVRSGSLYRSNVCRSCGYSNSTDARFCAGCGESLEGTKIY